MEKTKQLRPEIQDFLTEITTDLREKYGTIPKEYWPAISSHLRVKFPDGMNYVASYVAVELYASNLA